EALLGPLPFDIHGGGQDLIFPHHENEIAQSRCAHDIDRMARFWLHNGFVDMRGEKMSKSVGNVLRLDEALVMAPGEAVRLYLLSAHYRQPLNFTEEGLTLAKQTLDRFYSALHRVGVVLPVDGSDEEMLSILGNDLDTPAGVSHLHSLLNSLNKTTDKASA